MQPLSNAVSEGMLSWVTRAWEVTSVLSMNFIATWVHREVASRSNADFVVSIGLFVMS